MFKNVLGAKFKAQMIKYHAFFLKYTENMYTQTFVGKSSNDLAEKSTKTKFS